MIDAYLQVFKDKPAVHNTIKHYFRHYNSNSKLVLVSDGGDDFSKYKSDRITVWQEQFNVGLGKIRKYELYNIFARIQAMADGCENDYFFFLEDDVLIKEYIDPKTLPDGDMLGIKQNRIREPVAEKLTQFGVNCAPDFLVGGAGGTIYKTESIYRWKWTRVENFFFPFYDNWDQVDAWTQHQLSHIDYVLSVICLLHGQTYAELPCLGNADRLHDPNIKIVHGIKDWNGIN